MDPDALLFQRMKLGEPAAVDQFVEKYYPLVLRYCRLRIRDPGYAEDAAQETFARFFQTFPRYRHQGKAAGDRVHFTHRPAPGEVPGPAGPGGPAGLFA